MFSLLSDSSARSSTGISFSVAKVIAVLYNNIAFGLQFSSIYRIRSAGLEESIGTYAPPAFRMPKIPTIISILRSDIIATKSLGPTPRLRSLCAT